MGNKAQGRGPSAAISAAGKDAASNQPPLTLKEAHELLGEVRSASVLALLKKPNFAMLAGIAFMGFRVDSGAYANPVVRRRLAEEAVRSGDFAQKLRDLAAEAKRPTPPAAQVKPIASPAARPAAPVAAPQEDSTAKYRAERDRLRHERDAAVAAQREAERSYGQARADQLAAETAKTNAEREAERLRHGLDRQERRLRRLELENTALRRVAGTAEPVSQRISNTPVPVSSPNTMAQSGQSPDTEGRFLTAVRHLLNKEKWALAATLATDVLRAAPNDCDALSIRAAAQEGEGNFKEAQTDLRRLMNVQIGLGQIASGARTLSKLLALSTDGSSAAAKVIQEFYAALAGQPSRIDAAREVFEQMRISAPDTYRTARDHARGDIANRLFGPIATGGLGPDDPLPLAPGPLHGLSITPRRLMAAIDRNDASLLDAAREAARPLSKDILVQVMAALRDGSKGDDSYVSLFSRAALMGAAVVDGSNVAWHGQDKIVGGRPRLGNMLAVRKALRERGYFPVLLIADANLPYVVDEAKRVRQMERDGELVLAPSGTDADEFILREARHLEAPVISNDYMADWDPKQNVGKVQYDISLTDGRATLYF